MEREYEREQRELHHQAHERRAQTLARSSAARAEWERLAAEEAARDAAASGTEGR